jgi:hypothetical protein
MPIIGSKSWIDARPLDFSPREELRHWLRFALTTPADGQLIIKRDKKNFDVADIVLSRCEVALAFERLPKRQRLVVWYTIVKRKPLEDVAYQMRVQPDSVRRQLDRAMSSMVAGIYDSMEPVAQA